MQIPKSIDPAWVHLGPLVDRVRQGDPAGVEELHRLLGRGVRFLAARRLPASRVDGCVRQVFDRAVRGIRRGELEDSLQLVSYVRMHLTTHMREIQAEAMPGQRAAQDTRPPRGTEEHLQVMQDLLLDLSPIERQSMVHFYLKGHDDGRICRELHIPAAELRSLRVRVKSRFRELCLQDAIGAGQAL